MNKIEILSPVGSPDVLKAAVFSGADAVYLGLKKYSARENAGNFSEEELEEAVKFCRVRSVKVFVAINTLFKDSEFAELKKTLEFLCKIAVDAVIVQDLGLLYLAKQLCPSLTIHASTQMSLSSKSAVKLIEKLGVTRAVLAREMSLVEIEDVKKNTNIELEVFVHGALCMCVSGQCYFSAMLGSRSGNRGKCAQTCRLPFSYSSTENALSLKDLSFLPELQQLEKIGVKSAKIEGRMKREEYVAVSARFAKDVALTGVVDDEMQNNLEAVFSRSGFTKGYLLGKRNHDMFGIRTKEDVLKSNSETYAKIHDIYRNELQKVPLNIEVDFMSGKSACLKITDDLGNFVQEYSEKQIEIARNKALSEADLRERFSKLGGTCYFVDNIKINTDEKSILPMSQINALRRQAIEKLNLIRERKVSYEFKNKEFNFENRPKSNLKYRAYFRSISQIPQDVSLLDWIYLPLETSLEDFSTLIKRGVKVGATLPRICFSKDKQISDKVRKVLEIGVKALACGNLYAVEIASEFNVEIHGMYSLNIMNSFAVRQFEELGLDSLELSYEIKDIEAARIKSKNPTGIMVYGKQSLMLTRNCPVKITEESCMNCNNSKTLTDRKNIQFPVICTNYATGNYAKQGEDRFDFYSEVLNSTPLCLTDRLHEIKNIDFGVLTFTVENSVEIVEVLNALKLAKNPNNIYTRGLFYRGVF